MTTTGVDADEVVVDIVVVVVGEVVVAISTLSATLVDVGSDVVDDGGVKSATRLVVTVVSVDDSSLISSHDATTEHSNRNSAIRFIVANFATALTVICFESATFICVVLH